MTTPTRCIEDGRGGVAEGAGVPGIVNWAVGITADARARLHELYRVKLIQAEAELTATTAKALSDDPVERRRLGVRITVLTNRVASLRGKLLESGV